MGLIISENVHAVHFKGPTINIAALWIASVIEILDNFYQLRRYL